MSRLTPGGSSSFKRGIPYIVAILFVLTIYVRAFSEYRGDIGVRPLGMGGAFASLSDDPTGVFWNPAGISDIRRREFVYDLSQGALSAACPIGRLGVLGFSVVDMNYDDRFLIDSPFNPFGMFLTGDNQILLSYAKRFKSGVAFGWNVGYNRAADPESLWAVSFDFGVDVRPSRWLNLGMGIRDLNGTRIYNSYGDLLRRFDRQFTFGVNLNPHRSFRLSAAVNPDRRILRSGFELRWRWITLRGGAMERISDRIERPTLTGGISLDFGGKRLNYAYISDPEMRYQHLISVQIDFAPPSGKGGIEFFKDLSAPEIDVDLTSESPPSRRSIERNRDELQVAVKPRLDPKPERVQMPSPPITLSTPPTIDPPAVEIGSEAEINEVGRTKGEGEFEGMAKRYELDPLLVMALIKMESNFDPAAVSPAGAAGLMQLMPSTARSLGLKVPRYRNPRRPVRDPKVDERFDPYKNLEAGMRYLRQMMDRYAGNYVLAICAYNSGPGNVKKNIPAIRQTERFAAKVMKQYYDYQSDPTKRESDMAKVERLLRK